MEASKNQPGSRLVRYLKQGIERHQLIIGVGKAVIFRQRCFHAAELYAMVRRYRRPAKHRTGTAALEFAMVAPLLLAMIMGVVQFGMLFNNITVLTNATAAGALLFSQGRSFTHLIARL